MSDTPETTTTVFGRCGVCQGDADVTFVIDFGGGTRRRYRTCAEHIPGDYAEDVMPIHYGESDRA